jgi:hypothetical protein
MVCLQPGTVNVPLPTAAKCLWNEHITSAYDVVMSIIHHVA